MAPEVVLEGGDEASGLASMLAGLLSDNLRDFPGRARAAALARGPVVLRAADRDIAVTLDFRGRSVVVRDGVTPGAPILAGAWLQMAKLCSGQLSPVKAVVARDLTITPGRYVTALAGAGYVLSVPPSFYGDDAAVARRRRTVVVTAAVAVGTVGLVVWLRRQGRE